MHFVVGGAFNGKAKWVKQHYEQSKLDWRSAYHPSFQKERFADVSTFTDCTVLEGVEQYVNAYLSLQQNADKLREMFNEQVKAWHHWENELEERNLIIIGNDLSKGIVPVNQEDRLWRDVTGWCYQDLTAQADRVDLIWYGIARRLK